MARLIDADALKERAIRVSTTKYPHTYFKGVGTGEIDRAPTIEAEQVSHARWLKEYDYEENYSIHKCSNCGGEPYYESDIEKEYHYCPYCGAKMDGGR